MAKANKRNNLYKYGEIIIKAKLDSKAKALLWFYAYVYNWTEGKPSFWPQRRICASVGMSTSTYQQKRKYLEDLGWIKVQNRGWDATCKVMVLIGVDDPDYETKSWAIWHPSNEVLIDEQVDAFAEYLEFDTNIETQFQKLEIESSKVAVTNKEDSVEDPDRFDNLMEWFG
jgi:hypothetical protein